MGEGITLLVVLHQIHLHLIVFDAHVEVVDVGVLKTLLFFPYLFVQLATNVSTNVFERGKLRYEPAVAEERLEKFAEGTVLEGANSPRLFGRKVFERRTIGDRFGVASDEIGVDLDIIKKSGSWYSYGATKLGQGREGLKHALSDNPELMDEITEKIVEAMHASKALPLKAKSSADDDEEEVDNDALELDTDFEDED